LTPILKWTLNVACGAGKRRDVHQMQALSRQFLPKSRKSIWGQASPAGNGVFCLFGQTEVGMNRPPVSHITRRPHEEPPIRDDSGDWHAVAACWALVLLAAVLWWVM
jgi:hypothetical protein